MKVKNLTIKPMGFGSTIILPDDVGALPQGYDQDHPTVKYYLSRNWIKVVGGSNKNGDAPAAVNVGVNLNNDPNAQGAPAENTGGDNGGQNKLFAFTYTSDACPVTLGIYYRSMGWYGKVKETQAAEDVPQSNLYLHVAAVAKCLAYSAGSETWKFKQLASVVPSNITSTTSDNLEKDHLNYFAEYGSRNITMNGQVLAGEWIDVIRFRDWLQDDMQYRIYNLLIMNTKIPYTNPGIALVENQMIASLKAGQAAGGIAPDEFDSDGVLNPGFTVTVPNSMDLSPPLLRGKLYRSFQILQKARSQS